MIDEPLSESQASEPSESSSWKTAFAAPWIALRHPRLAGARISTAPTWAVAACVAINTLAITLVVLVLAIWNETTLTEWSLDTGEQQIVTRSLMNILQDWFSQGLFGPLGEVFLGLPFCIAIGLIGIAILQMPIVHTTGKASTGFIRAFKAGAASLGPLFVMTVLCSITFVCGFKLIEYQRYSYYTYIDSDYIEWFLTVFVMASALFFLYLVDRIARGVRPPDDWSSLPPMCEGCGYDLTHKPDSGRCSECGAEIAAFLEPGRTRQDPDWHGSLWKDTVGQILFEPAKFYARVRVRNDNDRVPSAFARLNYWLVSVVASFWALCLLIYMEIPYIGLALMVCCVLWLAVLLGSWGLHRAVVSMVFLFHLWRKTMPYPGFVQTVLAYEAVFLWGFTLFNGVLWTSFAVMENHARWLINYAIPGMWGIPVIVLIFLGGNIALLIVWFRRVHRALLAVRWSNF